MDVALPNMVSGRAEQGTFDPARAQKATVAETEACKCCEKVSSTTKLGPAGHYHAKSAPRLGTTPAVKYFFNMKVFIF